MDDNPVTGGATGQGREHQTTKSSVGATAAQAGYAYQLNVSVLAALRLLLITKSATRITLEPANEEDLETELAPAEPGLVTPQATLANGYKLVVQVKSRAGEPWSIDDFDHLLKHGERRTPAKHHLDDLNTHYLLVTNADAKGAARKLLVSDFEDRPDPLEFPGSLKKTLPNKPEGRVAIWGGLTEQLIEFQIKEILTELLRIPHSRLLQCCARLREESLRRMRGSSPGIWERDDLLTTIREHGGFLASAAELAAFVEPSNFAAMLSLLEEKNAIVITGPSGTGKTLAALALCERARLREGPLEVISVNPNDSPSTTRRLINTGPTLFYLEDPWGQYSLRSGAEAWTDQLPRLLRDARPSNQYVITSRSDVLGHARADSGLKRWSIELNADHYSDGQLAAIYEKRMAVIATNLQPKALQFRREALEALETPLELDLFFTNLADGPLLDELDHVFVRRLLDLAHRDAVEEVVVKYLNSIDDIGLSAVIWGLLAARGQFDRTQLIAVARQIRRADTVLGDRLEKTVDRLIATRHLRQPSRIVTFAHPSVRAGFETFLKENWSRSEATLELLVSALVSLTGEQRTWGLETAARTLDTAIDFRATIESIDGTFEATEASREAIDKWLNESLLDINAEFQPLLKLAADVGTSKSIPSEVARWFIKGTRRGGEFFIDDWAPPEFSNSWYGRVSADPQSAMIADRFIREQLPQDDGHYGREFVSNLDQIADGLAPAFLAAAQKLVGTPFHANARAVASGAVRDIVGYEVVLEEALAELERLQRAYEQEAGEQWRAIEDGECDSAYEEAYASGHDEDGYASGVIVDTYISAKRSSGCWRDLANHGRVNRLAKGWARAILTTKNRPSEEEVLAVLSATQASSDENVGWDAACKYWSSTLEGKLSDRILSLPEDESLRSSLMVCACVVAPDALIGCFKALASSPSDFIHLLVDLSTVQRGEEMEGDISGLSLLPPEAIEIFNVLVSKDDAPKKVGDAALALLETAALSCAAIVLAQIVPIIIASGGVPIAAVRRWLTESTQPVNAVAATQAAIAIGDESLIWLALDHVRADARCLAFEYLAPGLPDPLPVQLLNLRSDRGSRVRRALVTELSARPHSDHLPVLMQLTRDKWSDAEPRYDEPDSNPIAREAVAALAQFRPLPIANGLELLELAKSTDDRKLRREALAAAAEHCSPEIRRDIWAIVGNKELGGWTRVDAVDALSQASFVEVDIVRSITAKRLMSLPAPLAASVTVLVGQHQSVAEAVRILERLGQSHAHRALLLLGVAVLESRDRAAAVDLLDLLDVDHPARRLLDEEEELLPGTVLDDLGDVRIRRHVQLWLSYRIAGA